MWRIKALCDPDGVLAPGVVLDRDPEAHLRNLKTTPSIGDAEADKCVECGFCEPVCPSRDLTTTPRQRILIRRELARQPGGAKVAKALLAQEEYASVHTCAGDGTCKLACPVGIDTGRLMKGLRKEAASPRAQKIGVAVAKRYGAVERAARAGLRVGPVAGPPATALGRRLLDAELVPAWLEETPHAAPGALPATRREGAAAVYFPACINRIFGRPRGNGDSPHLPAVLVALSERAGVPVWIPDDVAGTCCATPWSSKGLADGARTAAAATADALWRWSDGGNLPVVVDATSCTLGLLRELDLDDARAERHAGVQVLDAIEWAHDRLLPALEVKRRVRSAAIHPTCAARHLSLPPKLEAVVGAVADEVVVPLTATCCGMAGDRGMLHPELPESALEAEAAEVRAAGAERHVCSNRTCEIALHHVVGEPYESFLVLLDEATR
jgi:D-lactate dehydrogenase